MEEPSDARETTVEAPATGCDRDGNPMESDESRAAVNSRRILGALEIVERDSVAIAESFNSLFSSLRLALSEVTSSSVEHMHCFVDAAGHLQESALDAATKGNHYINSCLRLNQEMKGMENLAVQLKILRRNVDALDSSINQILRFS
ncbi:hypothetical protein H6P81_017111 [Aristolochia fimbriata]|uniref:BLOC-1-related complex subunit 6 C-terminal helix domain-containing protein n=1 Tax=Aristolochia fimbriata TaxID=158543 RepID=A0AAV7E0B0_ARIFI|nr:hypothetical protein H6P81_017111 [Aristolochia fimbriata]